jgi:hypothetical protein
MVQWAVWRAGGIAVPLCKWHFIYVVSFFMFILTTTHTDMLCQHRYILQQSGNISFVTVRVQLLLSVMNTAKSLLPL